MSKTPPHTEPARFVILHDRVGEHAYGAIVTADELGGAELLPRLLELAAIAPVAEIPLDDAEPEA